jgi:oxalate decarboxylase/phosphoglucose isomerase-like protein (cupin superfamily)
MHWHPNADEWQYYVKGKGRMTVFDTGPNALTMDFTAGDIGYVKRNLGHYVENAGDTDLQFIGVFRAPRHEEVSLSNWLAHTPPKLVRSLRCRVEQPTDPTRDSRKSPFSLLDTQFAAAELRIESQIG